MTKKQIIITFSSVLVASYVGFFFYQRYKRKKADESIDSYQDALKKLQEAKDSFSPLYVPTSATITPEIQQKAIPEDIAYTGLSSYEYAYNAYGYGKYV